MKVPVVSAPELAPTSALALKEIPATLNVKDLAVPGGVACVKKDWLGNVKPSEEADCSNYWIGRR